MLLKNEFEVDAGVDRAWELLTDLERVARCMPGATLDGRDGDAYVGNVKIKVGPVGAHFSGTARFAEKDDTGHAAVISARGKDAKGQAAANARIHARLEPLGETHTRVLIDTDLDISGRIAQFGRGAIADVSNRLISQFVGNLRDEIGGAAAPAAAAPAPAAPASTATTSSSAPAAPATAAPPAPPADADIDVMALLLPTIRERYGQAIAGALLGFLLSWLAFGRRR